MNELLILPAAAERWPDIELLLGCDGDRGCWCLGCLRIRFGYRRKGVAGALGAGVIEAALEAGAPGVEAYLSTPGVAGWA